MSNDRHWIELIQLCLDLVLALLTLSILAAASMPPRERMPTTGVLVFAKPYHSWERGQNENANGLLR
jgi:hypothetical protein